MAFSGPIPMPNIRNRGDWKPTCVTDIHLQSKWKSSLSKLWTTSKRIITTMSRYFTLIILVTSYLTRSHYSGFIGYSFWCVKNHILLWAGHCVRGCCIRAKVVHIFKLIYVFDNPTENSQIPIIGKKCWIWAQIFGLADHHYWHHTTAAWWFLALLIHL